MNGIFFKKRTIRNEDLIRFPESGSDRIIEEIESFWDLEGRFKEAGVPYKRGIMMYGPPGSGKSCTLRIMVENLTKRGGIVFDFPSPSLMVDGYELLRQIHPSMPIIVLMEDMDAILQRSSESEVLNLLDGMHGIEKTVFVATTNHPERLGSRVMNRPSRFDKRFFIGMPSEGMRRTYIKSKLDEDEETVERWVEDTDGFSIAHIKELYVATHILGDDYGSAIETLREMQGVINSVDFDPYHKSRTKIYESCGTGKVYRAYLESRRERELSGEQVSGRAPEVISENSVPDQIANLISE